ncbi:MAG: UDP-N-acetylglucosamine 2-epimerase (non-hydrolyzing) [Bacteroidota bacterium]
MIKIVTVIGARPQFIKAAAISRYIRDNSCGISEVIVHTGQHFDTNMSEIFFTQMDIPAPDYHLNIHSLGHGAMTGQMLSGIEEVLLKEKPDFTLVYGDTNSTIAGALAAKKLHGRVAHVEAGLRSFNMKMPEEINRILTDRISDLLFCPTDKAVENLGKEGFGGFECRIIKSGDVMQDAALFYAGRAEKPALKLPAEFIILTLHRAENTDDPGRFVSILKAMAEISEMTAVIFPMHPRTKKTIIEQGDEKLLEKITVIEPVGYLEMIWMLKNCRMVMTDSGGLQKEAYFFKKPCVTLRDETEWVELVANGVNALAGSDYNKIIEAAEKMLAAKPDYTIDLYGNGKASGNIVNELLK